MKHTWTALGLCLLLIGSATLTACNLGSTSSSPLVTNEPSASQTPTEAPSSPVPSATPTIAPTALPPNPLTIESMRQREYPGSDIT
ncbi:MAG TPA: hypothetical protein VF478_10950, partial [Anaerolineae bacterium]